MVVNCEDGYCVICAGGLEITIPENEAKQIAQDILDYYDDDLYDESEEDL